jgi:hypothetical protein
MKAEEKVPRRDRAARQGKTTMRYDYIAIPDADVPQAVDSAFPHAHQIYASEANKMPGV